MSIPSVANSAVDMATMSSQSPLSMLVLTVQWLVVIAPAIVIGWFIARRRADRPTTASPSGPAAGPHAVGMPPFAAAGQQPGFPVRAMNVVVPTHVPGGGLATSHPTMAKRPTVVELVGQFHGPGVSFDVFSVSDGFGQAARPAPEQVRAYLPAARQYV